jgi:serine/threonine-protein kinase SBK
VQLIGEGWFSRVYLAEHRHTRDEVVLKAINSNLVTADEFCREYHSSTQLWPHKNILKVYDAVFQCDGYYMFAMEYAPLGDLTSNITEHGLAEVHTKHVACQVGSALQWIHSKNLCHLDVKLDNILVFKSDFSLVKLCDFGSVKHVGDIVIKKNELLPYCPAELVAKHANEYYQVDKVQDVFQFGIVVFFCLLGVLPWQKADRTDPHFAEFSSWREKRTSKVMSIMIYKQYLESLTFISSALVRDRNIKKMINLDIPYLMLETL